MLAGVEGMDEEHPQLGVVVTGGHAMEDTGSAGGSLGIQGGTDVPILCVIISDLADATQGLRLVAPSSNVFFF